MEFDNGVVAQGLEANGSGSGIDAANAASIPAASPELDIWAALENVDPEELLQRNPRFKQHFDGQVGRHAQRQAQQLAQQQVEAQRAALIAEAQAAALKTAEDARLNVLHDQDLFTWDQERQKVDQRRRLEEQQRLAQQAPAIAAMRNMVEIDQTVIQPLFFQMTPEAQARLGGKTYNTGNGYEDRRLAIEDIRKELENQTVSKAQADWAQAREAEIAAIRDVARRDTLAEVNGNESIDTGAGSVTGGIPTPAEWASLSYEQHLAMKKGNPNIETQIEMAATQRGEGVSWDAMKTASGG